MFFSLVHVRCRVLYSVSKGILSKDYLNQGTIQESGCVSLDILHSSQSLQRSFYLKHYLPVSVTVVCPSYRSGTSDFSIFLHYL